MTTESKILTVSYGTFSCTLEGFDDPFNTMKAIAEYFRDLAAEDRYFGAEPSQPDTAMLHRIAEREVARLVDDGSRDGSVVLRPAKEPAAGRVTGKVRTPRDPDHRTETAPPVVEPMLQAAIPGGVAAKLARIRQSVAPDPAAAPLSDEVLRSLDGDGFMPAPDSPTYDSLSTDDLDDLAALDMPVANAAGETSARDALSRLGALNVDPAAEVLRADVSDLGADDPETIWTSEPGSVDAAGKVDPIFSEDLAMALEAGQADDQGQDGADAALVLADVTALSEVASAALSEALTDTPADAHPEAKASPDADTSPDNVPSDVDVALSAPLAEPPSNQVAPEAVAEPDTGPAVTRRSGKSRRVSSRIVRIHPDSDEAQDALPDPRATRIVSPTGDDAEVARLLQQADDVMADSENLRRIESLAHLKAAVAAADADRAVTGEAAKPAPGAGSDAYRDDLANIVQPDPPPSSDVRPRRKTVSVRPQEPRPGTIRPGMISPTPLVLVSEQRIDRLIPSESPPNFAPAPLAPAAVAAEHQPSPETTPEVTPIQQGHGLPGIEGTPLVVLRTGRLTGAIGAGAASAVPTPERQTSALDRIVHSPAAEPEEDDDFDEDLSEADEAGLANFAERVGVKSMADMLEAAAAYATCIEKRDRFTRPQLMRRLMASAGGKPISREDGLRSFGTLLRTGRIEKISRGHYALAEHSPYLAEARRPN